MSNPWDEVEAFVRERRQRDTIEQERTESKQAFDGLNAKVDKLAAAFGTFMERSTTGVPPADGGTNAPQPPNGSTSGDGANPPSSPDTHGEGEGDGTTDELPLETVSRMDVPRMYTGDDEPNEVQYIDPESGETRTRKGRRKGRATLVRVEPYEPAPGDEQEGVA